MSPIIIKSDVNKMLHSILGNLSSIENWWHSENTNFNFKTPDEIYQSGDTGRQLVYDLVSMYVHKDIDREVFEQSVADFFKGKK
jgi:hypothetical protein